MATTSDNPLLEEFLHLAGRNPRPFDPATLKPQDTLIVVDMQNDFLPGGAFGVAEGDKAVAAVTYYMQLFAQAGCFIVATRDYHPIDHCSFTTHSGPFPVHCVQGSPGSRIIEPVVNILKPLVQAGRGAVVYKGFSADIDSFGAFAYSEEYGTKRVTRNNSSTYCEVSWTGAYALFSSMMSEDLNAPPDVMSVLNKVSLASLLTSKNATGTVYVVGLALDFCVLDTARNASRAGNKSAILIDASRAAHVPGLGTVGSGFLNDPREVVTLCDTYLVELMASVF